MSADDKRARLDFMRHFPSTIHYPNKDQAAIAAPDPLLVSCAMQVLGSVTDIYDAATHPTMWRG